MLRLRTLGGLSLDGADRPLAGAAVQRRRVALLAVIASGGAQGVSRDRLLGFFWPEREEERARHALAQSLYALRRALGEDALVLGQHELRLNPAVIGTDLWEFERALAAGQPEGAVRAYGGLFLDGVYVDEAPDFERWAEVERERLRRAYTAALGALAAAADTNGAVEEAVTWWRRLAVAEPLAAQPALGLMRALTAAGNAPAALQHARAHEEHLRTELDVPPAPEVVAFVQQLRDGTAMPASPPISLNARSVETTTSVEGTVNVPDAPASTSRAMPEPRPPSSTRRRWRMVLTLAAGCAVLVALAALTRVNATSASDRTVDHNRIAVFPFAIRGDSANAFLGTGMVDVLSAAFDGAGRLRAVDPRALLSRLRLDSASADDPTSAAHIAAGFGAGLFVLGGITQLDERVQVTAFLYDVANPTKPIGQGSEIGLRSEVLDVLERVAAQLAVERSDAPAQRLAHVAAVTTRSLPALKEYLTGESEFRAWNFGTALEAFQRAVALDTNFALGYYRLSIAADWMGRDDLVDTAAARAVRFGSRLSARDRQLVEALLAWRRHDSDDAERRYREILLHYPDDVETWYQLGEVLFHDNPSRGRSFAEARMPFERALALEPDGKEIMVHLMRIAAWEARWDTVASLVSRMSPDGADPHLRPYSALASHDAADLTASLEALRPIDGNSVFISAVRLALYTRRLDVAARTFALLTYVRRPPGERAAGHSALGFLAATRGRWRDARAHLDSARALRPHYGLEAWARLALVPSAPLSTGELAALRDTVLRWHDVPVDTTSRRALFELAPAEFPLRLTAAAGLLAVRLSDTAGINDAISIIANGRMPITASLHRTRDERVAVLRAEVLRIAGKPEAALAAAPHLRLADENGMRDHERFLLGELSRDAGRMSEALQLFGSFEHTGVQSLAWAADGHFARAQLLERLGRGRDAAAEYERIVELWSECDAELRPMREEALRRATAMKGANARAAPSL